MISLPVVIISIVLFFVLFFGIGFLLNMLLRMSWIMAVIYPIVCLFIISKKKLISYVQSPGESFASLFHRVLSLAAADVLILVSGLVTGAIVSGIAINMLRKRGYQMF
nr:YuiB family protein [Bacillus subtilis]